MSAALRVSSPASPDSPAASPDSPAAHARPTLPDPAGSAGSQSLAPPESLELWEVAPELGVVCAHCQSRRLRNLDARLAWRLYDQEFTVLRCTDCQGQLTYPSPSPELLGRFYKDSFSYKWYRDHYPAKFLDALHRVIQYRQLGAISDGPLLDYGGGIGYFGRAARLLGYKAETRDPMYESVTEKNSGPAAPAQTYATITCHHVLEHAIEPAALLRNIRSLLQPEGTLILAVPNGASLGYARRGVHWVWSQPPLIHLHHITPAGLRSLLLRTGFTLEKELFFDRWDASVAADVHWAKLFGRWDGQWGSTPWKWGTAQLNSLRRFAALAASYAGAVQSPSDRSELLIIARPAPAT